MISCDKEFCKDAELSSPKSALAILDTDFGYAEERVALQALMREIAKRTKGVTDARLEAARQQAEAIKYLSSQQRELAELQRSQYSGGSPWSFGCAYKVPRTNLNLSCTHQNGKTSCVVSVLDEPYQGLLTPNQGFVTGVEEGNAGLSFNINL